MNKYFLNPFLHYLKKKITDSGAITIENFITEALYNPYYGYYHYKNPFGKSGDFITSPEISQIFGELIGIWISLVWYRMDCPRKIDLIEFGPGKATLMLDALRTIKKIKNLWSAVTVRFIETSPLLSAEQYKVMKKYNIPVFWYETFQEIPKDTNIPLIVIGNEFLDALPIRQFLYYKNTWTERMVGLNKNNSLHFINSPKISISDLNLIPDDLKKIVQKDDIFEISPKALQIVNQICCRLNQSNGVALFIDYGYLFNRFGNTLQAIRKHRFCPILSYPGQADISAHVNFSPIIDCITQNGTNISSLMNQNTFLKLLGIYERAENLKINATPKQNNDIDSSVKRLVDPNYMGELFKVLIYYGKNTPIPPCTV